MYFKHILKLFFLRDVDFKPPCVDLDTNCAAFKDGSCTNLTYRAYMRENCRSFCNECYCE